MPCDDPPPRDTLGYAFYVHACPRGVRWQEVRDRCLTTVRKAKEGRVRLYVSGNDSRYVVDKMAEKLGVAADKKKVGSGYLLLEVLEKFFNDGVSDEDEYAMPSLFKATYYERNRGLKKSEKTLTGNQIALSYCGALLTYVGYVGRGLEGQLFLLIDMERPTDTQIRNLLRLVEGYRSLPIQEASFALKRLYMSAYVDEPAEPVELFIATGDRATLMYVTRFTLYELSHEVKNDLQSSGKLLYNDKVLDYATRLAALLELYFESTYRQVGTKKFRRVEWLYEAGRMLEALASTKSNDEDTLRAKKYAEIMLPAVRRLISDALAEV